MTNRTKLTARFWGVAFALLLTTACAGEEETDVEDLDGVGTPPAATTPPTTGPGTTGTTPGMGPMDSMIVDSTAAGTGTR